MRPGQVGPGGPLAELVTRYAIARNLLEMKKAELKPFQADKDAAEAALFDAIESAGFKSVRDARLGLFTLSDLAEPLVVDPPAFIEWAETHMPEALTVNRQRLGVIIREVLKGEREPLSDSGDGLPPGVEHTFRRTVSWRRAP